MYLPYTLQCSSVDVTVNHCKSVFTFFFTLLGVQTVQCSGITVESWTPCKKCKKYIEYICSVHRILSARILKCVHNFEVLLSMGGGCNATKACTGFQSLHCLCLRAAGSIV